MAAVLCLAAFHVRAEIPDNPAHPTPGIEAGKWWEIEPGNPGKVDHVVEGNRQVVKLSYSGGAAERAGFKYIPGFQPPKDNVLHLHLYAPDDNPPDVTIAVGTTLKFIWHESDTIKLVKGWNAIAIPLTAPHWKTAATAYKLATGVERLDEVRYTCVLVHNGKADGYLLLEGFAADTIPTANAAMDTEEYWKQDWQRMAALGGGFVVWMTPRTGRWRIWTRNLDGSGERQLSPDEKGRDHGSAHISQDGKQVVYLSYPEGRSSYTALDPLTQSPLHLMNADGSDDHIIVADARSYWGERCVVWVNSEELIYVAPSGATRQLNLRTKADIALLDKPLGPHNWLVNATHSYAITGKPPSFSPYDGRTKQIALRDDQTGCQPYFSQDGRWGIYMAGSGGPVARINLATTAISDIIQRHDPSLPSQRGYIYLPMISRCGNLLAFSASNDEHSFFSSNYDVFVAQLDPVTLQMEGRPVRYTFDKNPDNFPDVFLAELPLGRHQGKAPLEVDFGARKVEGEWNWDFGDGAVAKGVPAKHTYTQSGKFEVSARQGDKTLRGMVRVQQAIAPYVVSAGLAGEHEIRVAFSEPVQPLGDKAPTLELESKNAIKEFRFSEDRQSLYLTVSDPVSRADRVSIGGLADLAQHPNALAADKIALGVPAWPSNPNGLVFCWETGNKLNEIQDSEGKRRTCKLKERERARYDNEFRMCLDGGSYLAEDSKYLLPALRTASAISIEVTVSPADLDRDIFQRLVTYSSGNDDRNFTLALLKNEIVARIRTPLTGNNGEPEAALAKLDDTNPIHLIVSYKPGLLRIYINGREKYSTDAIKGGFENWADQQLVFGDELTSSRAFHGKLEGVAIYNRFIEAEEAGLNYQRYGDIAAQRRAPKRIQARLSLTARAKFPTLEDCAPYTRALVVYEYDVLSVLHGTCDAKKVRVAHWALLDGRAQPIEALKEGSVATVMLEPFDEQPQLKSDYVSRLKGSDIPLYYDAEP